MFRQDLQDNQDIIFAFPEERQKTPYLFEVIRLLIDDKIILHREEHPLLVPQSFFSLG